MSNRLIGLAINQAMFQLQVENMGPNSTHLPIVATHIAKYLKMPDLVLLQEIQDDSGATDDGTVIANQTLQNLVSAIVSAGGGFTYEYVDIAPVNDEDGGMCITMGHIFLIRSFQQANQEEIFGPHTC
jgi:predicted extracellular nuclease